jgi:cysteine desulfurase
MLYLDYSATYPVYSDIVHNLHEIVNKYFFNPSSLYEPAVVTKRFYENHRIKIANYLNVKADNIIFTSSATEGANLIIKGLNYRNRNKIILWEAEHACVYQCVLSSSNIKHTTLKSCKGYIAYEDIKPHLDKEVKLVCLMHVNNETGAINDINKIAKKIKEYDKEILVFSDMVQSFAKIPIKLNNIDFATFSAHKIGGLRGVAALYFRNSNLLKPLIEGGGQEFGLRSGTENVLGAYTMVEAIEKTKDIYYAKYNHIMNLNNYMREFCKSKNYIVNSPEKSVPYIFNFSTVRLPSEVVINGLSQRGIYVSSGSACSSKRENKSRILKSMVLDDDIINTSIRISLHPSTKLHDINEFFSALDEIINIYG